MKFVRGDSIAGIVIILINILGGLAVGVLQLGMPLGDAVRTYSILTIGDGLVAQIPALLSAIAAGLIVTRTAGEGEEGHLGTSIARDVGNYPRVLLTGGVLAFLLAFVPGFPWPVFVAFGVLLLSTAMWRWRHESPWIQQLLARLGSTAATPAHLAAPSSEPDLKPPPAVVLEASAGLVELLGREHLSAVIIRTAERLREEYGAPIASPVVRVGPDMTGNHFRLTTFGVSVADTELNQGEELESVLERALRRQLSQFAGIQETSNLLNRWSRDYPDLIKEMLRAAPAQRVSEVLRRLLDEGVPIRQLRDIFEAITEVSNRERDIVLITEQVRIALRRHITQRYVGPDRAISALIAHPELEDALRQALRGAGQSGQVAVDPQLLQRVVADIRAVRDEAGGGFARAVLLCSMDIRRHLRKLIEGEFFELPVLSFQELSGDVPVVPLGQVRG